MVVGPFSLLEFLLSTFPSILLFTFSLLEFLLWSVVTDSTTTFSCVNINILKFLLNIKY